MPIHTNASHIDLGYVDTGSARLSMFIDRRPDGTAQLGVYVGEADSRRSGEVILLGYFGATELRQLLDHAEGTIRQLVATGQITGMAQDR